MPVDANSKDAEVIRRLIPVSTLSAARFNELCSQITIEEGPIGTVLFRQGDSKKEFVYLLSGTITLHAGGMAMDTIVGGSDASRFAIAHQLPRKVNAVASSKIRYLRINGEFFNKSEPSEKSAVSYEVSDIPEESSGDWMTNLLKSPIFQRLPPSNLQKLLMALEEVKYPAGRVIVRQGDPGDFYYIIKDGCCALSRKPSPTAKEIKLGELRTSDAFGEDSLLSGAPRNVTVTASTDTSLLRLDKARFLSLVKQPVLSYVDYETALEATKNGAVFLDVRSPDEFGRRHLDDSINVPFFSLRVQLAGLDRSRKHIVVCEDGNASGAAAFLLIRNHFDAVVLEGGINKALELDRESLVEAHSEPAEPLSGLAESEGIRDLEFLPMNVEALTREQESRIKAERAVEQLKREVSEKLQYLSVLEQERSTAKQGVLDLQKELEALKQELANLGKISASTEASLKQKVDTLNADLSAARDALKHQEGVAQKSEAVLRALESERETLQHAVKDSVEQLNNVQSMLDEKRDALSKEIADKNALANLLKNEQEDAFRRIKELEDRLSENRSSLEALEQTNRSLHQELQKASDANTLLGRQKQEMETLSTSELEALRAQKQALEHTVEALTNKAGHTETAIQQLVSERDRLAQQNGQLAEAQQEAEALAGELQKKLAALESELDAARTQSAQADDAYRVLSDDHRQIGEALAAARSTLDSTETDKAKLEAELARVLSQTETLQQALDAEQASNAEAKRTLEKLGADARLEQDAKAQAIARLEASLAALAQTNESLAADLSSKAETEKALREQLEEAAQKLLDLEEALGRQTNDAAELEAKDARLSEHLRNLQDSLDAAFAEKQSVYQDLQEALDTARSQQSATLELRQAYDELEKANHAQAARLEDSLAAEKDLRDALETARAEHQALRQSTSDTLSQSQIELEALKTRLDIAEAESRERAGRIEAVEAELASARCEKQDLEHAIVALHETLESETHRAQSLEQNLATQVAEKEAARQQLADRCDELTIEVETAQREKQGLATRIEALEQQTTHEQADAAEKLARLEQSLADLEDAKKKLAAALEGKSHEAESLHGQLEDLQRRLNDQAEAHAAALDEAEARLREVSSAHTAVTEQAEALEAQLDAARRERQGLEKQIEALAQQTTSEQADAAEKLGRLERTAADLEDAKKKLTAALEGKSHEAESLHGQLEDLQRRLNDQAEAHAAALNEAEARLREVSSAHTAVTEQADALEAQLDAARHERQGLEKQIEALAQQTTSEQADAAERLGELERMVAELTYAKEELAAELDRRSATEAALRAELDDANRQRVDLDERILREQAEAEKGRQGQREENDRATALANRCAELSSLVEAAQSEVNAKAEESQRLADQLAAALEEKMRLAQDLENLASRLENHSEQILRERTEFDRQAERTQADHASLEQEIDRLRQENDALRRDAENLYDVAARVADAERMARTREEELQFNEDTYGARLSEFEVRESALKTQLSALTADNSALKAQLDRQDDDLNRLHAELAAAGQNGPVSAQSDAGSADDVNRKLKWLEQSKAAVEAENRGYLQQIDALGREIRALKASGAKTKDKENFAKQLELVRAQAKANIAAMTEKLAAAEEEVQRLKQEQEKREAPQPKGPSVAATNPGLAAVDLDVFSLAEGVSSKNQSAQEPCPKRRGGRLNPWAVATISALLAIAVVCAVALGTEPGRDALRSLVLKSDPAAGHSTQTPGP